MILPPWLAWIKPVRKKSTENQWQTLKKEQHKQKYTCTAIKTNWFEPTCSTTCMSAAVY